MENIGAYLNAIYPGAQDEARHVDVVTAVVDRIPTASVDQEWSATTEALNGGREGLSVAYLESSDAAPDLWESHPVVTEDITMSIQQQCSISFALRQNKNPRSWQKVQLPVANTLFLNGRTSTLLAQSWVKHPLRGQDETNSFNLVEERTLQEQVINLTSSSHPNDWHMESELNSALTPITKPREVAAAVGNIVQKMYVEDNLKALPASQELEGAIQSIIQKGETPAAYIEVWALITPKGLEKSYAKITHDALQSGCQLRKVLSGGGGWGVKQGLLSLDPDAAYGSSVTDPHVLRSSPDSIDQVTSEDSLLFKNENISPQEFLEDESPNIFENLVKPGDIITFFVNKIPEGPSFEPIASDGFLTSGPNVALPITLQFGTLPSTIDAPPATVDERSETESKTPVSIVRSHFGMLSEQGMSFEVSLLFNIRFSRNEAMFQGNINVIVWTCSAYILQRDPSILHRSHSTHRRILVKSEGPNASLTR